MAQASTPRCLVVRVSDVRTHCFVCRRPRGRAAHLYVVGAVYAPPQVARPVAWAQVAPTLRPSPLYLPGQAACAACTRDRCATLAPLYQGEVWL